MRRRNAQILFVVIALLTAGGAVALLAFGSSFGVAGKVLSTVLGAIAIGFLSLAGISISTMSQILDVVKKVREEK
jgi:hypothetical protein